MCPYRVNPGGAKPVGISPNLSTTGLRDRHHSVDLAQFINMGFREGSCRRADRRTSSGRNSARCQSADVTTRVRHGICPKHALCCFRGHGIGLDTGGKHILEWIVCCADRRSVRFWKNQVRVHHIKVAIVPRVLGIAAPARCCRWEHPFHIGSAGGHGSSDSLHRRVRFANKVRSVHVHIRAVVIRNQLIHTSVDDTVVL